MQENKEPDVLLNEGARIQWPPFGVWFAYGLVAAILVAPAALNWSVNGDLFWQRWLGERILATHAIPLHLGFETFSGTGAPWIPQEWLLGVLLASSQRGGVAVPAALAIVAVVAAMAIETERAGRRGASGSMLGLCAALVGLSMLPPFGIRGQVFAWPFFALLLLSLEDQQGRLWPPILITALWSNVHASVTFAPLVAAIYLAGSIAEERAWTARATRYAVLVPLLAAATCVSPLGLRLPLYAISLSQSPIRVFIAEWQHPGLGDYGVWLAVIPLFAGLATLVLKRQPVPWRDALLVVVTGFLAADAVRNIPLFAMAASPIVCAGLTRAFSLRPAPPQRPWEALVQAGLAAVILPLLCVGSFRWFTAAYARDRLLLPIAAMHSIAELPGTKRLLCYDFADCDLALGDSRIRVFLDGRCDPYPWSVWRQYRTLVRAQAGWRTILERDRINVVLLPLGASLERPLLHLPKWRQYYRGDGFVVFRRRL